MELTPEQEAKIMEFLSIAGYDAGFYGVNDWRDEGSLVKYVKGILVEDNGLAVLLVHIISKI